ncbi:MAG: ABC transporter permease [Firmicutes bacterium]|nr:ABC transporter permease [Bacillota bacterium]
MKPADIFSLARNNLARGKLKNALFVVMFVVTISGLLITLTFYFVAIQIKSDYIDENITNRELIVSADYAVLSPQNPEHGVLRDLNTLENIKYAYPFVHDISAAAKINGNLPDFECVLVSGSPDHFPAVAEGDSLVSDKTALLPDPLFIPLEYGVGYTTIDAGDYIGRELKIAHPDGEKSVKVAGIYDRELDRPVNEIWLPLANMQALSLDTPSEDSGLFTVVITHSSHRDETLNAINNLPGLTASAIESDMNPTTARLYNQALELLTVIILIITVLLISLYVVTISNKIRQQRKMIALLKAIGYRNAIIFRVLLAEILMITLLAYSLSILSAFIVSGIALSLQSALAFPFQQLVQIYSTLILFALPLVSFIGFAACLIAIGKVRKISPTILLKNA